MVMNNSTSDNKSASEFCQAFRSLFKGRTDCWGGIEGLYNPEPVTPEHYKSHLEGKKSLGIYFVLDNHTCNFAAIDIDDFSFNKAVAVRDALKSINIPAYIAASKSNHFHVYLFAEDRFIAKDIKRILNHTLKKLGIKTDKGRDFEVFPKQDKHQSDDPPSKEYPDGQKHPGSYINLPCCGVTRPFLAVGDNGAPKEIPLEVALERIKRTPNKIIEEILEGLPQAEEPAKKEKKTRYEHKKHPVCIESILEGVTKGGRNEAAFALACYYLHHHYTAEDTLALLQAWDKRNNPPLNDELLIVVQSAVEKKYPFGCSTIRDEPLLAGFCVGEDDCEWLKEIREVKGITIDGITYYQRNNEILKSHPGKKEDDWPVIATLASFSIEPRLRVVLPDEDERLETLVKTSKGNYPVIFRKAAFNSKRQLLTALPLVNLQYYGTDKDTQAILALLTREELPKRKGTTVLGRNGNLWVLKDKVISNNGVMDDPNIMYIPSGIDLERRVRYSSSRNDNSNEIAKQLVALNEQAAILPILGWFFVTPFTPLIRGKQQHFPLLSTWGTHGAGKSSLLELLSEIFGLTPELHSAIGTKFSLLRLFSATNSIPIVLDELKPYSMEIKDVKRLTNLLRRAYGGEIEDRGRADLSTVGYHIQAPIAVAGEMALTSIDSAFMERCIQTNLNPDNLTGDSSYVKAFRSLKAMDKRGFAFSYIKWCLATDFEALIKEAETYLPEDLKTANERIRDNILVMLTGLIALKCFSGDESLIDKEGIVKAITNERAELLGEKGYPDIALTTFLETLATLAQTNRIRPCIHYMTDVVGTRLYIHLEDCLAEFRKFVRETVAGVEVLDKKAYRQQAKEMLGRGYVLEMDKDKWFPSLGENVEGKNRKCLEIDITKLPFDASGFLMLEKIDKTIDMEV